MAFGKEKDAKYELSSPDYPLLKMHPSSYHILLPIIFGIQFCYHMLQSKDLLVCNFTLQIALIKGVTQFIS